MILCSKAARSLFASPRFAYYNSPLLEAYSTKQWNVRGIQRGFSSVAGSRISSNGLPELDLEQTGVVLESTPATTSRTRILTLNRPASLNALNLDMSLRLSQRVLGLNRLNNVDCIVLQGAGKAFCSGGDLKELYTEHKNGNLRFVEDYFRTVYGLNWLLKSTNRLSLVSLLDGVVMGGGMGLAMGCRYRVVTENSVVAMPEVSIGLHPDTGMSYWGSRLPGEFGQYLATGVRINGRECLVRGIATHFIPSQSIPQLLERLGVVNEKQRDRSIQRILDEFADYTSDGKEVERPKKAAAIEQCFKEGSALDISKKLQGEVMLQDAAAMIKYASPLSIAIAIESIRNGKKLELKECIKLDYRLSIRLAREGDFFEGIRALIVDKDKLPKWKNFPKEIAEEGVDRFFEPFSEDENCAELNLDF